MSGDSWFMGLLALALALGAGLSLGTDEPGWALPQIGMSILCLRESNLITVRNRNRRL